MRFLQIGDYGELSLVERAPDNLPPYAILSHTWGPSNEEVTYQDFLSGIGKGKAGYSKLALCGRQAARDGFQYFWSDTCCIDKTSSAELSEAINSMFAWYQAADVCYAYLADVKTKDSPSTSKWFTRGWTLQELLAPQEMVFFDGDWNPLGTRVELRDLLSERTRIPTSMLSQEKRLETFSVAQRMSWAAERRTTRIEDIAYCMLGIFDINMPLIYGEGENAFIRLQEEIMKTSDDHSLFAWRSTDDRGGCLATSPASFRGSSNIVQTNSLDTSYDPAILSSRGVNLDVRFTGIDRGKLGCAILNCCTQGIEDYRIAIFLRDMSLTMGHSERVKSDYFADTKFEGFDLSQYPVRKTCIQRKRIKTKINATICGESHNALSPELMYSGRPKSLLEAVQKGDEDNVWLLLTRQDIDVNEEDDHKRTPLSHAAGNNKETIVKMLISRTEVHINTRDEDGRTPMWWAAKEGHEAVVRLLLETDKVDVNSIDNNGLAPLSVAVQEGDTTITRLLLGTGRTKVDLKDNGGRTPLSWAVAVAAAAGFKESYSGEMDQRFAVINLLLEMGKANANSMDKQERTPLSWATATAVSEHRRMVAIRKLLVWKMVHTETNAKSKDEWMPLVGAVLAGDIAVIKLLLETGDVDVNSKDKDGSAPLIKAVMSGRIAVVELLLGVVGIDVNIKDKDGRTPLSWAVTTRFRGNNTIVRMLLKSAKVDVNLKDDNGQTPLLWAVVAVINELEKEDEAAVMLLLEVDTIDVDAKDKNGRTPLSWAAEKDVDIPKNKRVIETLLRSGKVDVDSKDNNGRTPLSWAAQRSSLYERPETVRLLLNKGIADVNSKDKDGRTPLSWAAAGDYRAKIVCQMLVLKMVESSKDGDRNRFTGLSDAALLGDEAVIMVLLETFRFNINMKDNDGRTPLSRAVQAGNEAIIRMLVAGSADVNSKDEDGLTPLLGAVIAGNEAIIKLLMRYKANLNLRGKDGLTPLLCGITTENEAVVKLLLETGKIDVSLKDKDGLAPLSRAVLTENKEVIRLLLETGQVNIKAKDKDGQTPLSRAALIGNEDVIELLKTSNLGVNANDKDGRSLLTKTSALVWGRTAG